MGAVKEPAHPDSTLLIGRVTVDCKSFPQSWHVNGEHTSIITVYLIDASTQQVITLNCRNKDGFFYFSDPDSSRYILAGFSLKRRAGRMQFTASTTVNDKYFDISENCVNNLGDIQWTEVYTGTSQTLGGGSSRYNSSGYHNYFLNYDEVEKWFKEEYSDSAWNSKNWVSVEYKSF